jgi:hypothetical protein
MSTNDCNCGGGTVATLDKGSIERPRFFPRQLITPDDLTLGQDYFRNKLRRHNRYLHGWGVVCGTRIVNPEKPKPWKVVIERGYILGPYGDEILLEREICFDLRTRCVESAGSDACSEIADPLCPDQTFEPRRGGKPYYIAVRYKELPARPVRVQAAGCGCDDSHCEYSRWRDGYEICVLDRCPTSHETPPDLSKLTAPEGIPDCPPCPEEPWVVLAQVETDEQGNVKKIDNCVCRRMVLSLAPYWWKCKEPADVFDPPPPGGPIL